MKEKLIIKNFGPIKSVNLDLGKLTVLIGEQATGKSTIAKVLSICRYFSYIVDDSPSLVNYESKFVRTALRDWGLIGFERDESYIKYINPDYEVEIKNHENYDFDSSNPNEKPIKIPAPPLFKPTLKPISDKFKKLFSDYQKLKPEPKINFGIHEDWHIPHSFLTSDVKSVMKNPFYFPTERGLQSIFSIGKRGLENLNDRLYEQLAALNGLATNFKKETEIKPLDIHFKYENGQAKFKGKNDSIFFNLTQGASGYQTTIPIVLAIKFYTELEKRKRTFIVEEPEINLFPSAQRKLMTFFVENINVNRHSFLIPTHSPYFLSAINDLLVAYKRGQIKKMETNKIIKKEAWLNPDDLSVYELKKGKASKIFDKKSGLISNNIIDDVSDEMNDEFERLLELK